MGDAARVGFPVLPHYVIRGGNRHGRTLSGLVTLAWCILSQPGARGCTSPTPGTHRQTLWER